MKKDDKTLLYRLKLKAIRFYWQFPGKREIPKLCTFGSHYYYSGI